MGQPVAAVLGRQQRGDQVVARLGPPLLQQLLDVLLQLDDRALDLRDLAGQRLYVELPLYQAGPFMQPRSVLVRRTSTAAIVSDG